MRQQPKPPPPGAIWFTVRSVRENLRAVDMNAEGIYVGYTGSGPRSLGWRRRISSSYELVPMDIPGNGFGSAPRHISREGIITGQSSHPMGVSRPYLWTPTQGNVAVAGLNDNHAPLVASETRNGTRLLAGNHGNRAYVVVGETISLLPLPPRATRTEAQQVRFIEWKDNRGTHLDQAVIGSVTFQDGPLPALWYRDEGSAEWRLALTEGRRGMAGAILRCFSAENYLPAFIIEDVGAVSFVRCSAVGYSVAGQKKRASVYWYYRNDQSLNGVELPLLVANHESMAYAACYNKSGKRLILGHSGNRATLWEMTAFISGKITDMAVFDLNLSVVAPAQTVLTEAVAISATGLILCNGTQQGVPCSFLLEPTAAGHSRLSL
jgi:hypothetical protein